MNEKEKARELITEFLETVKDENQAKKCALKHADELLIFIEKKMKGWVDWDLIQYWKNVKLEIEKYENNVIIPEVIQFENPVWMFQFDDDEPILLATPIGENKELTIKIQGNDHSNIVISDKNGKKFKIFSIEKQ